MQSRAHGVDTAAIDMMANDAEAGIRFEKRIENMDGFTRRGGDDFRMEWNISPRDRRVELDDRVCPVTAVDTAGDFATIAEMNMLSVRRRGELRRDSEKLLSKRSRKP